MLEPDTTWTDVRIALLTAGRDKPYAYGMATALMSQGLSLDIIGGNDLENSDWPGNPSMTFFNLRGDMRPNAKMLDKILRVLTYYLRLVRYSVSAKPNVFHILWNNKLEVLDRTILMLFYRVLGKRIVLTVHNVNARRRDGNDTWLNRITLKMQYRLADHLFVHTEKMRKELAEEFGIGESFVTVVPFGINNDVPSTSLTGSEARKQLGISADERTILFFGHIAPYKGLEHLVEAFRQLLKGSNKYRLIIAGNPKNCVDYWSSIEKTIENEIDASRVVLKIEHIPDGETEIYFKAADVLALPYRHVYQSGVLFLGYGFGLPVIATDVGSLREDIIEGKTGFVCKPGDSGDLASALESYFSSPLFQDLNSRRRDIQEHVHERHSWNAVGEITAGVYKRLLGKNPMSERVQVAPQ
jgi:glycosyltransferase involved in cell wall biosynthesis